MAIDPVEPDDRLVEAPAVLAGPPGRLERRLPVVRFRLGERLVDAGPDEARNLDLDGEREAELLPGPVDPGGGGACRDDPEGHPLRRLARGGPHLEPQLVFFRLGKVGAPLLRLPVQDERPALLTRNCEERVGPGRHVVSRHLDRVGEGDRRRVVGAEAPEGAVRDELSPDPAPLDAGLVVADGDGRDPDRSGDGRGGARLGETERRLRAGSPPRGGERRRERSFSCGDSPSAPYHVFPPAASPEPPEAAEPFRCYS